MFTRVLAEYPPKERTAGAEQHLVGSHPSLSADQRDVDERLGVQQRLKGAQQMCLVVVPAQAVVLLAADGGRLVVHSARRCRRVCRFAAAPLAGACAASRRPPPALHPVLQPFRLSKNRLPAGPQSSNFTIPSEFTNCYRSERSRG